MYVGELSISWLPRISMGLTIATIRAAALRGLRRSASRSSRGAWISVKPWRMDNVWQAAGASGVISFLPSD